MPPTADLPPLREPTLLILLSLAPGLKHGYAILKDVEELSQGRVRLSTGTLYEALGRLLQEELIERVEADGEDEMLRPRKVYRLSPLGRRTLEAEVARMQRLVASAGLRLRPEDA